jgi:hypothetical protein
MVAGQNMGEVDRRPVLVGGSQPHRGLQDPGGSVTAEIGSAGRRQRSYGRLCHAVCSYCSAQPGQSADPRDSWTWLEHDGPSADLDTQLAVLRRHDEHHRQQPDPTATLPIWTWSDRSCPRCPAPTDRRFRTSSGRPRTVIHSGRWHGQSGDLCLQRPEGGS